MSVIRHVALIILVTSTAISDEKKTFSELLNPEPLDTFNNSFKQDSKLFKEKYNCPTDIKSDINDINLKLLQEFSNPPLPKKSNAQLERDKIKAHKKKRKKKYSDDDDSNQFNFNQYNNSQNIFIKTPDIPSDKNNSKPVVKIKTTKPTKKSTYITNMIWFGYGQGAKIDANTFSIGFRGGSFGVDMYKSFSLEYEGNFHDFTIPHDNYYVIDEDGVKKSLGLDLIYFVDLKKEQSIYLKGGLYGESRCKFVQSRDTDNAYCHNKYTSYSFSTGAGYMYSYKNLAFSAGYHLNRGFEATIGFKLFK